MMQFRGLELHGKTFWNHRLIERSLDVICDYRLTALVIHETDFMTEFFFPTAFFNPAAPWDGAPARRGENALHNNMAYFHDILKRAERKKIDVWIEVKEITFPDEIIARNPSVMKDGHFCPTDPLWADVIRAKYRDLVELYPAVKGVIVSAGSPEGRASLSQKKCRCERCAATSLPDWYTWILNAMYEVLAPNGVLLAVREFSYNVNHQIAITEAMDRMPEDVIYCIKVTPHDFYPTFPDNTLIERASGRTKWIEYDTMGQYYGWGVLPCLQLEDIEARFAYAAANGVDGALLRVEWERINDYWSVDSPNRMNLLVAANSARGIGSSADGVVRTWLAEEGIVHSDEDVALLSQYLSETWDIFRHALYVNDFVLNDSSMVPPSIERAWWSMADKHSLAEWFPERAVDLDLDERKVDEYIAEKEQALARIEEWRKRIDGEHASTPVIEFLRKTSRETGKYVRLHLRYGTVCLLASLVDRKGGAVSERTRSMLGDAVEELERYAGEIRDWLERSDYRHQMYLLFNPDRCMVLVQGGKDRLAKFGRSAGRHGGSAAEVRARGAE